MKHCRLNPVILLTSASIIFALFHAITVNCQPVLKPSPQTDRHHDQDADTFEHRASSSLPVQSTLDDSFFTPPTSPKPSSSTELLTASSSPPSTRENRSEADDMSRLHYHCGNAARHAAGTCYALVKTIASIPAHTVAGAIGASKEKSGRKSRAADAASSSLPGVDRTASRKLKAGAVKGKAETLRGANGMKFHCEATMYHLKHVAKEVKQSLKTGEPARSPRRGLYDTQHKLFKEGVSGDFKSEAKALAQEASSKSKSGRHRTQ